MPFNDFIILQLMLIIVYLTAQISDYLWPL